MKSASQWLHERDSACQTPGEKPELTQAVIEAIQRDALDAAIDCVYIDAWGVASRSAIANLKP